MAEYRLLIKPSAVKEIEAIGVKKDRQRVIARISALSGDPRPSRCEKLAGSEDRYRIRQGNYRVVYTIDDVGRVVEVFKVGHRREVYRKAI
ncbi:MAG: type II toxin-antitoxin system RelE family toxin [Gammaproteobacteria bacterium]